MLSGIHWLADCGAIIEGQKTLLFILFLAGLTGSLTHCLTMCTPFVLMQTTQTPSLHGSARLLLPYHAGRLTTYAVLGAVVGGVLSLISGFEAFQVLRRVLLVGVAVAFLFLFAEGLLAKFGVRLPFRVPQMLPCGFRTVQRLIKTRHLAARYALGLSLGLLPCGLVASALAAAAATGTAIGGAAVMLTFGLGTAPALIGVGLLGQPLFHRFPWFQDAFRLTALGANAAILFALSIKS